MTSKVILTALGSDRPGLTQALAEAVYAAGGNWLESHLSRLGGKYVGSVLVEIADLRAFEKAVRAVDAVGLDVSIVPAGDEPATAPGVQTIELVGQDRPGIVREVTSVLAGLGVNIEEFTTTVENGAWSGELLFRAVAKVSIPERLGPDAVRAALEDISGEIMVDFNFAG